MCYLSDFKEINRGYVAFGGNPKGGKITGKGKIKTGKPVCAAVPRIMVTRPRHAHSIITKSKSPIRRHITRSPSPKTSNSPPRVTDAQALVVSAVKELNGRYVTFRDNLKGGKISSKGMIKTGKLYFKDVYFVKELKFNLFSVLQMCDKKNKVLFTDTECLVLSPDFKLPDESQVLLRVPRENNIYNVNLKNNVPSGDLTCLFAKATIDESNFWHRRLGHINFKTINKLVKLCELNGIKREFSVPRTPQQNGIAEKKNKTLMEAARTMLTDSLLPIPFWAEAVNTA
nr:ribonuclease H-like domain-containing protein [Tanacetum cinerariifolium]